jgi:hypothetical protein
VVVEVKSVEILAAVHRKQHLTYLRLADKRLGLLINFQVALIKDGTTRIVNGLEEEAHAKPQAAKTTKNFDVFCAEAPQANDQAGSMAFAIPIPLPGLRYSS